MANNRALFEDALARGHSHSWDQDWDQAIDAFTQAITEINDDPAPYAGLGMAYLEQEELKKALDNYKLAARYSRGDIIHLRQVADVQERLGLLNEAGKTYNSIGEIEIGKRNLRSAQQNWQRAAQLAPDLITPHRRLASVYSRDGNTQFAIREYLAIARILSNQGDKDKALRFAKEALKLDPRNAEIHTAIEMIKQGEAFVDDGNRAQVSAEGISGVAEKFSAVKPSNGAQAAVSPVQDARRLALEQLAEEIFSDSQDNVQMLQRATLLSQALDYQRRNMSNEAISAYEQAISAGVNHPAAHFNLGLLYQNNLRFDDAIREFQISVDEHEFRLASHFALGESYRAKGLTDQAIEHFINVLKIVDLGTVQHTHADRLIELYENLADSFLTKGKRDEATDFANSLVEFLSQKGWEDKAKEARSRLNAMSESGIMILGDVITSGSSQVLESLYLAQEYTRRGMYDTAIEELYLAIQFSPEYLPAHMQLAETLGRQGRLDAASLKYSTIADTYKVRGDINGAVIAYEKVVSLSPLDVSVKGRLIDLLKRHGKIDKALEQYLAMGEAYSSLAQTDNARSAFQDGLKLAPRASSQEEWETKFLSRIAEIDMKAFNWRQALTVYKKLRVLIPEDERTAITLVDLYYKVGQPNNAIVELDRYLKQLVRSGRSAKVGGILEDMVSRRPSDPQLVERLSRLYVQQQNKEKAVEILDNLAEAQVDAGEINDAVGTIERVISLNPHNVSDYRRLLSQLKQ